MTIDTELAKKGVRPQVINLLKSHRDATYREIGDLVGVSRQRVHQIAKGAGLTKDANSGCYRKDVTVEKVLQVLSCSLPTVAWRLRAEARR